MALDSVVSPSFTGTKRVMDAFSQGVATGRIPSRRYLDRLIQAELDAAENNAIRQRAFQEQIRQFNVTQETNQRNAEDTAAANRTSGLVGSATNLASTAGMMYLLKPKAAAPALNPVNSVTGVPTFSTPVNPNDVGGFNFLGRGNGVPSGRIVNSEVIPTTPSATGLNNRIPFDQIDYTPTPALEYRPSIANPGMDYAVPAPTVTPSATQVPPINVAGEQTLSATQVPVVDEATQQALARQAAIEAEQAGGTGLASAQGNTAGMGGAGEAGTVAGGGGPTIAGGAAVLGYIALADTLRQQWGQLDKPYGERGAWAKFASAPVTGGVPALMEVAGMGESNYFAKGPNRLARVEEKLVGEPLDLAFKGDIGGSLKAFGGAVLDAPLDLWNASVGSIIPGTDTWLCTEIWKRGGIDEVDNLVLQRLRRYAIKNHRAWIKEYLEKGKTLVAKIAEAITNEAVRTEFYAALKANMVGPVVEMVKDGKNEEAFQLYKDYTWKLFDKYAPGVLTIDPAEA